MSDEQPNNLLHGITLQAILEALVERYGWPELAARFRLRCFQSDPSVGSSLAFLRKNEWARRKIEQLYLEDLRVAERNRKRNKRRAAMRAHRAAMEAGADAQAPSGEATDEATDETPDEATVGSADE